MGFDGIAIPNLGWHPSCSTIFFLGFGQHGYPSASSRKSRQNRGAKLLRLHQRMRMWHGERGLRDEKDMKGLKYQVLSNKLPKNHNDIIQPQPQKVEFFFCKFMGCCFFAGSLVNQGLWGGSKELWMMYFDHVWSSRIATSNIFWSNYSDLTRPKSPNCGLVREFPLFQGNLGWWNIIIWPDIFVIHPSSMFMIFIP